MSEITMPRLSDTMQEGTIVRWRKRAGDEIKKGDILAEIETDKATMDLEAYEDGTFQRILVQEGETAPIGQTIALVTTKTAVPLSQQPALATAEFETEKTRIPPDFAEWVSSQRIDPEMRAHVDRSPSKASPLARRMAEEHGIGLDQIQGTGPGGRIVRDDIIDFLEQHDAPAAQQDSSVPAATAPVNVPSETEPIPFSRVQSLIAHRLSESKRMIPHFYVSTEVDMTDLLEMRQRLNTEAGEGWGKVTINDGVVKACALALEKFPEVNSTSHEGQFFKNKRINIGIAVDVPWGLVVPVIGDANEKGLRAIAREARALVEKARTNTLAPIDLEGGTFSISNLGMMDTSSFIAVINPPQVAILAVSSTRKRFVPIDGQPAIRDLMTVTLSADHRILYGATAARFLQEVKHFLENPYSLLS